MSVQALGVILFVNLTEHLLIGSFVLVSRFLLVFVDVPHLPLTGWSWSQAQG